MTTQRRLATKAQAVRAFRELLATCYMSDEDYYNLLHTFAEMAKDLADDELIFHNIAVIQAEERAKTKPL
ncbi:MAG: hypothetical protein ABSD98_18135 [Candidatus Korobacteraceae bacterium]|jgi:hypothetical protein